MLVLLSLVLLLKHLGFPIKYHLRVFNSVQNHLFSYKLKSFDIKFLSSKRFSDLKNSLRVMEVSLWIDHFYFMNNCSLNVSWIWWSNNGNSHTKSQNNEEFVWISLVTCDARVQDQTDANFIAKFKFFESNFFHFILGLTAHHNVAY